MKKTVASGKPLTRERDNLKLVLWRYQVIEMEEEDGYLLLDRLIVGDSVSNIVVKETIGFYADEEGIYGAESVVVEDKDSTTDLTDVVPVISDEEKQFWLLGDFGEPTMQEFEGIDDGVLVMESNLCLICEEVLTERIALTKEELEWIKKEGYSIREDENIICAECYNRIVSVEHPGICERCGKVVKTRNAIDAFSVEDYDACKDRIVLGDGDGDQAASMYAMGGVEEFAADEVEQCYYSAMYTAYLCDECYNIARNEVLAEEEEEEEEEEV